jgi:hypothetical protein
VALLAFGALLIAGKQGFGGVLILAAPIVAFTTWKGIVDDRARALGKAAFARGYAQSRSLKEENPRLVQARHMRLRFPGVAETAMSGDLPGSGRPGALLFTTSKSGRTRSDWDVVVLEDADVELPQGEKELQLVRHEKTVAVYRKSSGERQRTAADVDAFLGRVTALAAGTSSPTAAG